MLNQLNTKHVGGAGLLIGAGAIISSVAAFFKLLTNVNYLDALYVAIVHAHGHALTTDDILTYAQLAAACIAIIGAVVLALLMTYFGKPFSVSPDPSANIRS